MKFVKIISFACLVLFSALVFAQLPAGGATLPSEETPPSAKEGVTPTGAQTPATKEEATTEEKKEEEAANPEEEMVYLNVQDQDIKEVIKQISKATNRNFIIDSKVSGKVTILSNKMMTKEEAYQAFLSALQVAGFTTVSGPGGVIKIVALRDAKTFPIPTHIDTTPYTDSYITRLIKLDNISANDMAEAIKGLISKDGNLFAYPETNTLVLTDSGTNIDRLMKIIKELDQEGPQQVVEIIPIHFASAKELAGIVLNLFEEQKKAGGSRPTGGLEEIAQVSKIIADDRTNSIIVLASKRSIDKVKELINRLDAKLEEGSEGKIHVYYLKYAKAKDIATVLQGFAGQASKPAGQPGTPQTGPVIAELEDFKVSSDDTTNSLLIIATAKTFNNLVEKVIGKLDIPRKQVYLEAMVLEFFLSNKKQFGLSGHGGVAGGDLLGFGETFQQLTGLFDPFNAQNSGSAFLNAPGILGGILARRTVDIKVTKPDGTLQTVSVPAFSAFLTALNVFGNTNLVASPNLLALDNEESTIEILRSEPEPGQQTNVQGVGLQTGPPNRVEAGLTLKLTPQITEKGTVRMKIDQSFSSFSAPKDASLKAQAIVKRKVQTSVITNDGQTVVIGGLMQDQMNIDRTKIPLLGDIPLLGYLFQKRSVAKDKSNLLLFITPHIIRDSSDFETVLQRKVGQENDFLNKNFKKSEREDIKTVVKGHNTELLDILEKGVPSAATVTPVEAGQKTAAVQPASTQPPVITAKPEEEPHLTLMLPPSTQLPEPAKKEAKPAPAQPAAKEVKEVKAKPVESKPSQKELAPPPPAITPPVIIPPREIKKQAQASPVESNITETKPAKVVPKPVKEKAPTKTPATSSKTKHAPVVTLPPGTTPDLGD